MSAYAEEVQLFTFFIFPRVSGAGISTFYERELVQVAKTS